jgi:GNAT superfamily N-acetyltransferase
VTFEYRNPATEDIDAILDVINTSNKDNPLWEIWTREEFMKRTFEHEDFDSDGYWFVLQGDDAVGYGGARVVKRRLEHGQNDGWIDAWVVQDQRGKGIERELVRRSVEYLRERGVAEAKHFDLAGTEWRNAVMREFGFEITWHEYFLTQKKQKAPSPKHPDGLAFDDFLLKDATENQLTDLMTITNDTFSETPNFTPQTVDSLKAWKDTTLDIVRINFAKLEGVIAGYCISEIEVEYNRVHNCNTGWIGGFGVTKKHRRKGTGKALLVDAMRWLWDQGMDTVFLAVDEENPKALSIYESVGFEIEQEGVTFTLEL